MARCIVTGGAGFIGSHIVEELIRLGYDVAALDDLSASGMANLQDLGDVELVTGSITDPGAVSKAMQDADYVFHEAALVSVVESVKDPAKAEMINVQGSRNVLEAALDAGVNKVILASSAAVYGDAQPPVREDADKKPLSPYGESKLEMEKLALEYNENGLDTVSLRYFNVYGPRQGSGSPYSGVISRFMDALMENTVPVIYGDGTQTRDFIYVKDVARANILAIQKHVKGDALNIATGKGTSIRELLSTMSGILNADAVPELKDWREGDIKHSFADISKAKELIGFEPSFSLDEGLRETIAWRKASLP
jgi:UDP-glucose 4-epimerase